jgi:hypothetical protein
MYAGKLVFAQVMEFAPWHTLRRLVAKYRGDFNVRTFSCLDQFLTISLTTRRVLTNYAHTPQWSANLQRAGRVRDESCYQSAHG